MQFSHLPDILTPFRKLRAMTSYDCKTRIFVLSTQITVTTDENDIVVLPLQRVTKEDIKAFSIVLAGQFIFHEEK